MNQSENLDLPQMERDAENQLQWYEYLLAPLMSTEHFLTKVRWSEITHWTSDKIMKLQ